MRLARPTFPHLVLALLAGPAALAQTVQPAEPPPVSLEAGMTPSKATPPCGVLQAPEEAKRAGLTGLVLVRHVVHLDGSVSDVEDLHPKAPRLLFDAARDWLMACRYEPARRADGTAVAVRILQTIRFNGEAGRASTAAEPAKGTAPPKASDTAAELPAAPALLVVSTPDGTHEVMLGAATCKTEVGQPCAFWALPGKLSLRLNPDPRPLGLVGSTVELPTGGLLVETPKTIPWAARITWLGAGVVGGVSLWHGLRSQTTGVERSVEQGVAFPLLMLFAVGLVSERFTMATPPAACAAAERFDLAPVLVGRLPRARDRPVERRAGAW